MKKVIIICIMMLLLCVSNAPADSQALTDSYQVTIYEPVTAIPMAPTVIADGMTAPGEIRPATVLLSVTERGGALYTRNEAGEEALLEEQLGLLEGLAMPMLQIQDAATAQALRGFLAQKELSNAFVISDDAQLVGTVCNDNMYLRPVLDFPQGTQRTAKEICDAAYLQGINIVSIDQSLATQEMLYQLQQHYLTVFVRTSGDDLSLHTQILSGANGIITENWRGAIAALESYTDVTVVQPSHVIGHRGNPEYAPDNTLRSIASAAESGADIIEIDVRTTADGVLLMCHDKNAPVMGRTQYAVEETELSVLTAMELADARAESTDRLATLEEGLALIKESYPDIVVEIDLKDRRIETALAIRELAEKYDMLSNITLLSSSMPFNTQALAQPHNGWAEQRCEDWLEATEQVLRGVCRGIPPEQIKAVGLTGQMNGLVCLGSDHKPLRPVILWCDQRSEAQCHSVNSRVGAQRVKDITCNVPIVGVTATKWLWVKENEPDIADKTRAILLPKDYIRFALTGEMATDMEDGSGMLMMDVPGRCWSPEMLSALEIRRKWVGKLYESHCVTGTVSRSAAERTGLPEGIPVIAGAGDNGASAIGLGVIKEGDGFVTIGTSGVVFAPFARPAVDEKYRVNTYCAATPDMWHTLGAVQAAGLSLRWFRDMVYPQDTEYEEINRAVGSVPPGAKGVVFLPYLMGERTPYMDPQCRGAFFGLSASTTKEDMARAVMEGISMGLCDCLDIVRDMGISLKSLRFCGGGAKSAVWRQMLADMFGIPVSTGNGSAALGAAVLAAVGCGMYANTEEACRNMTHLAAVSDPVPAHTARYAELLQAYRLGYAAQKEISQRMSAFR